MAQQQRTPQYDDSNENESHRPICPVCNVPMWLNHVGGVEPKQRGHRTYTYKCASCGREAEGEL